MQAYATACLVLVFGKGDKENISKSDTNAWQSARRLESVGESEA